MPQQINLCTPILLAQKRYFSAQAMVQALAVFLLVGGSLFAYWVWSLKVASQGLETTLQAQARDLEAMQAIVQRGKLDAGPAKSALAQELANRQAELARREQVLQALQRGLYQPGWGHSARLQLVAQSIPAQAWVTEVKADEHQLEVVGFTLEPSALNDWVAKLAASPLLQGQQLTSVKVESAHAAGARAGTQALGSARALWSFHLLSSIAQAAPPSGGKP